MTNTKTFFVTCPHCHQRTEITMERIVNEGIPQGLRMFKLKCDHCERSDYIFNFRVPEKTKESLP